MATAASFLNGARPHRTTTGPRPPFRLVMASQPGDSGWINASDPADDVDESLARGMWIRTVDGVPLKLIVCEGETAMLPLRCSGSEVAPSLVPRGARQRRPGTLRRRVGTGSPTRRTAPQDRCPGHQRTPQDPLRPGRLSRCSEPLNPSCCRSLWPVPHGPPWNAPVQNARQAISADRQ